MLLIFARGGDYEIYIDFIIIFVIYVMTKIELQK